uniref:Uncharacterized protein n=1 Tax=Lepeophtheirus salmonis TaxID=72036 RepID=A0A0K2VG45_LEPSM
MQQSFKKPTHHKRSFFLKSNLIRIKEKPSIVSPQQIGSSPNKMDCGKRV